MSKAYAAQNLWTSVSLTSSWQYIGNKPRLRGSECESYGCEHKFAMSARSSPMSVQPGVLVSAAPAIHSNSSDSASSSDSISQAKNAPKTIQPVDLDRSASPGRIKTIRNSYRVLKHLTPKQLQDFMNSYVIYGLDWENEAQMIATLGPDYSTVVHDCLISYYSVLNHLCALGEVEKMYIPPVMNTRASILDNQLLYEEFVAREIGLKSGDRVLDLGCGRGRVAAHMSKYTGARVTGLNIDADQLASARSFAAKRRLPLEFIQQDFNVLPLKLESSSFDAFYQIQALSLCKDLPATFREIYRVMKPGAKLSLLDWVSLPAYDPENSEHAELMRRVKPLIGAVGTPTVEKLHSALQDAGFHVVKSNNQSIDGLQAPLIERADGYFRRLQSLVLALVKLHILPPHFKPLMLRLTQDGQAFIQADRMRLITTSYHILAEKPQV
ncbi:S-adenosyl-L-methionine-dependent methyltransferase [Rhodocollybia butyracea]|uniref:S-adenosyl-L-methionine-dependent methyltransferase n=1 Tax=Rhodocollybia butyracea TaxID=206335 RepID=A0A9P5Q4Q8_9AGAR|nr:S-adenosyl-L-methionine-dependent methyltransferase [Rhodocollybia butyracea]